MKTKRDSAIHGLQSCLQKLFSILGLFFLASCSFFSGNSSESIRLPDPETSIGTQWNLKQVSRSPYIYQIVDDNPGTSDQVYVTAIKDCTKRRHASAAALSRQLLVGLKQIRIEKQEKFEHNGWPVHFARMSAVLDSRLIRIASYTLTSPTCVHDYVVWSPVQGEQIEAGGSVTQPDGPDSLFQKKDKILDLMVKDLPNSHMN